MTHGSLKRRTARPVARDLTANTPRERSGFQDAEMPAEIANRPSHCSFTASTTRNHDKVKGVLNERRQNRTCRKGEHRWTQDGGRRCSVCKTRRTRMPGTPPLVRLAFGSPFCELCKRQLEKGEPVSWWAVASRNGGTRRTAYCATATTPTSGKEGTALRGVGESSANSRVRRR